MHRVFVYGTLLIGESNHQLIEGSRFIGPARTVLGYRLFDLGPFPAMIAEGAGSVAGEVFEVTSAVLEALDRLEGHPEWYQRTTIALADGTSADAYLMRPEQVEGRLSIASGDWRDKHSRMG
jgi:gamma-glutamylaminecyclotransferase